MLLNQTAVYALRAIAVLAAAEPGGSLTADALSEQTGIPRQYLAKVMRRLVVAELVDSQRGQGGGFTLRLLPDEIRIADVLAACDTQVERDQCAFGFGACDPDHPCALHPIWSRLNESVGAWAEQMSLAHLGPHRAGAARSRRHKGN